MIKRYRIPIIAPYYRILSGFTTLAAAAAAFSLPFGLGLLRSASCSFRRRRAGITSPASFEKMFERTLSLSSTVLSTGKEAVSLRKLSRRH